MILTLAGWGCFVYRARGSVSGSYRGLEEGKNLGITLAEEKGN